MSALLPALMTFVLLLAPCLTAEADTSAPSALHDFNIPAQSLDSALIQLAQQAGVEIYMSTAGLRGLTSNPIAGRMKVEEALQRLLSGRGIQYSLSGSSDRSVIQIITQSDVSEKERLALMPLAIEADYDPARQRHEDGHNAVYDKNYSSAYIDKQQIERNKGSAPADVFKGMLNVYSGDPRNSGAIDPNIRGIQGPGRVPLTIDGTEQALTAYRGSNGANNRNYIDPNLLSSIQVIKGPSLERDIRSGVGGAVVARTLEVDDILSPDRTSGGELRIEYADNAAKANPPTLLSGQDYRNIPGFLQPGESPGAPWNDPSLRITPRSSGQNDLFSGNDQAYRLALGTRQERFELLGAYAFREKGNHFAGKRKAGFYSQPVTDPDRPTDSYATSMALYWKPGQEVLNTSNKMESWLLKGRLMLSDEQDLRLGIRDTDALYGEIMPSRLEYANNKGHVQWPLSHVQSRAYNLEYRLEPSDNPWLDLHANLWMTRTRSDTYTRGGFPNAATENDPTLWNSAITNASNDRYGLTLSNRLILLDNLDLTLGGSFQHEKLDSNDRANDTTGNAFASPHAGTREEYELNYNFNWRPLAPLTIEIGGRYSSYWAFDDYLHEQQKMGNQLTKSQFSGRRVSYTTRETRTLSEQEWQEKLDTAVGSVSWFWDMLGFTDEQKQNAIEEIKNSLPRSETLDIQHNQVWHHDGTGRYDRAGNPCINGSLDGLELIADNQQQTCVVSGLTGETQVSANARKQKNYGWTPSYSLAVELSENSRIYFRHIQALRYPSMFESTSGFSANINPNIKSLKPEHTYDYEISYINDISRHLSKSIKSDIKVGYYYHKTKNLIERDANFNLNNMERHEVQGIELEWRYDSDEIFTELGVTKTIKNRSCDESFAVLIDPTHGSVPDCVDNGFPRGYLITQSIPKYSATLLIGRRLLENRLETGIKANYYHKQHYNEFHKTSESTSTQGNAFSNVPFQWRTTTIYDAYLNYKASENIKIEILANNLLNTYYIDPLSRSLVAAPGRTIRAAATIEF